jgi:hypothetical protein
MARQAMEMLESRAVDARIEGRSILLKLVQNGEGTDAKNVLLQDCATAIRGRTKRERTHTRGVLCSLAGKEDSKEAKKILEEGHQKAIEDLDFETLVFLGMNGAEEVSKATDAALERNFDRIKGNKKGLGVIVYIASMSVCTLNIRKQAAQIAARHEKRAGNLEFIRDATDNAEIKNIMIAALSERGIQDTCEPEEGITNI